MSAVNIGRDHPRILYVTNDLRVVLRALARYPEGYVEIERRTSNAMNVETWQHVDSFSLAEVRKVDDVQGQLLQHFLRTLVPELQKDSRSA